MATRFIRRSEVMTRLGFQSRTTITEKVKSELLTPPIYRANSSFWPEHEVEALCQLELAGASKDEIQTFVRNTVAARRRPEFGSAA